MKRSLREVLENIKLPVKIKNAESTYTLSIQFIVYDTAYGYIDDKDKWAQGFVMLSLDKIANWQVIPKVKWAKYVVKREGERPKDTDNYYINEADLDKDYNLCSLDWYVRKTDTEIEADFSLDKEPQGER